jgi:acyl-CoA synthetase (AMP-forming)/AMP-acid ligase II
MPATPCSPHCRCPLMPDSASSPPPFHVGARVVLLNYLLPRDVLKAIEREKVTGLTAVPPLYIQLTQLEWPQAIDRAPALFRQHRRAHAARDARPAAPRVCPKTQPFLMYGLTEAFRSTYLPPEEVDRRPDSIGKAIPNAEILVLREDGSECAPDEPGELVHRGPLVGMGYWNDPEKTAERYKPLPPHSPGREAGAAVLPEIRRLLRRHRAHGRRGLPLLHRPARRDDQDLGLPRQPHRGRGNPLRHQAGRRVRGLRCRHDHARPGDPGHRHAGRRRSALDVAALLAECRSTCRPTWCRTGHRGASRSRCRATPTARSTARRSPTEWVEEANLPAEPAPGVMHRAHPCPFMPR